MGGNGGTPNGNQCGHGKNVQRLLEICQMNMSSEDFMPCLRFILHQTLLKKTGNIVIAMLLAVGSMCENIQLAQLKYNVTVFRLP